MEAVPEDWLDLSEEKENGMVVAGIKEQDLIAAVSIYSNTQI